MKLFRSLNIQIEIKKSLICPGKKLYIVENYYQEIINKKNSSAFII